MRVMTLAIFLHFNSRPSARGDGHHARKGKKHDISIHAPPRGATSLDAVTQRQLSFQFTPLREGRRRDENAFSPPDFISIHAPPRGATQPSKVAALCTIFQFTPLREGRLLWLSDNVCPANFNSRPSARGDAPQNGGTQWHDAFQFTPLREGRRATPAERRNTWTNFNSRPSARGDGRGESRGRRPRISIHAPPRGATYPQTVDFPAFAISIHAPPRGATHRTADVALHSGFQFTPLREGRLRSFALGLLASLISIHAPPRGATPGAALRKKE